MAPLFAALPAPQNQVQAIKVLPDKAPDCSSLESIVKSVTRGCQTDDQKAIAIYNFMRLTHYHRAYPSEPGGVPVLKEINCYGWSLCGGLHSEESALWRAMGWNWRFVGWPGHTTVEAEYGGRWHYLDVFMKFYAWMPDANVPGGRTIAGEDDLAADPQKLITDNFVYDSARKVVYARDNQFEIIGDKANWQAPAFLVCGDTLQDIANGVAHKNRVGPAESWEGINHATGDYSADVNLAPGFALTNTWDKVENAWYWAGQNQAPSHTCGDKEIRNSPEKGLIAEPYLSPTWDRESYANGSISFTPNLAAEGALSSFAAVENAKIAGGALAPVESTKPAYVTVLLQSPYILTQASGSAEGLDKLEVSIDGGKTWKTGALKDFSAAVKGQVSALVKLTFTHSLKNLKLQATIQNNPFALPFLSPGKNHITVSTANPAALGENKLVVTYAYRTGARSKSYEQMYDEGKEIARGHDAAWDTAPTVVQKVFTAKDLPAAFDIDVPTPKGKYPVFPRMVFVRREVIAPNGQPLPLPEGAHPPKASAADDLKTLPNPFLTGCQAPPAKIERPFKTVTIALQPGPFIAAGGTVPNTDFLRWPKNNAEAVEPLAYLIGGDLKGLPPLRSIRGARLVFPIYNAHPKAPSKVGVTVLKAPYQPGQLYAFDNLGEVQGTVVVPRQEGNTWNPPKQFKVDVLPAIRAIARGDSRFNGFALRIVPDRSLDDGWTVRVYIPKQPAITLELDVYSNG